MVERKGYAHQQFGVDCGAVEDIVDVGSFAVELCSEPFDASRFRLGVKHLFYPSAYMEHILKRAAPSFPTGHDLLLQKKKTWNDVRFISLQASPNAYNRINSPLPRLVRYIGTPLAGERT